MKSLHPIMLAGTGSDVGKSVIATGLCRIFSNDGYSPAPFKAQNMALNSYATPDGKEIGRAQAVQAEAARVECCTDMNPLLLKPSSDKTSQVVLNGVPIGNRDAYEYFRVEGREELRIEVHDAFDRLASKYNPIVMEGAGSIAEINLKATDLVNMSMARHADADVILVADIDRGGVFASVYGSIMLQDEEDRKRIKGVIVNKFRGDMRLFDSGRKLMEYICGVPVLGVVPYFKDINIEEEDSVSLSKKQSEAVGKGRVNVAVVLLNHISNFTDFDALEKDPRVHLFYTNNIAELAHADVIIVPGSKSTIADLQELKNNGVAEAILKAYRRGCSVVGICGGFQMMGLEVNDPDGLEGDARYITGLGLLPVVTTLADTKVTRRVSFDFNGSLCQGYEIHMGRSELRNGEPFARLDDGSYDGCRVSERCWGSYVHGVLDNSAVVDALLAPHVTDRRCMREFDYSKYKQEQYDALARELRKYVDMEALYKIMGRDD
ncbi:MAG: cobyric acid synthase [Paramuribaculum sp.]|nr:cobyric acid synthase [Paramuribaculum sp.]